MPYQADPWDGRGSLHPWKQQHKAVFFQEEKHLNITEAGLEQKWDQAGADIVASEKAQKVCLKTVA